MLELSMTGKGYWVFQMDVTDPDGYKAYQDDVGHVLKQFGAQFVTRGGRSEIVEGKAPARTVILEFKDYETAVACWNFPEYIRSKSFRTNNSVGNVIIVEGYDGPQPSDH